MSYCTKCGNKVDENMTFCPRCGASLKAETMSKQAPPATYRRDEKSEKQEKKEKQEPEKGEKNEKGERGHIGWLIAGIVIIIIGMLAFLRASGIIAHQFEGPIILLIVGIAIIIVAIWFSMSARKRNPPPA